MSSLAEDRLEKWGLPVPPELKHGNRTRAYKVYGCDCKVCLPTGQRRPANGEGVGHRQRQVNLRARKRGTPVPAGTKHGRYAYRTYACRCEVCVASNNAQRPNQVWKNKARGIWTETPKTTTLCWPPRNAGPDWQCPDPSHKEAP